MTFGETTTLSEIIDLIRTRLLLTGVQREYIIPTIGDAKSNDQTQATQLITITDISGQVNQPGDIGGRDLPLRLAIDGRMRIVCKVRLNIDTKYSSEIALSSATVSVVSLWQKMMKALHQWDGTSGEQKSKLIKPMRAESFQVAPGRSVEYVEMSTPFTVNWHQSLE